jgi:hypothetical protein
MTDNTRVAIENMIPQLIQKLDHSGSDVRRAVVDVVAKLAKNGVYILTRCLTYLISYDR